MSGRELHSEKGRRKRPRSGLQETPALGGFSQAARPSQPSRSLNERLLCYSGRLRSPPDQRPPSERAHLAAETVSSVGSGSRSPGRSWQAEPGVRRAQAEKPSPCPPANQQRFGESQRTGQPTHPQSGWQEPKQEEMGKERKLALAEPLLYARLRAHLRNIPTT